MPRSKKSFYGWRSRRSEKHAAESSSIGLGGWRLEKAENIGELFPLLAIS